jgi:hypothetical protein
MTKINPKLAEKARCFQTWKGMMGYEILFSIKKKMAKRAKPINKTGRVLALAQPVSTPAEM